MTIKEGKWNCSHCGLKAIKGRLTTCPNCSDIRSILDPEEQVYLPKGEQAVTDAEGLRLANLGPSWTCGACGEINPDGTFTCTRTSCRQKLDEDDFVHSTRTYVNSPEDTDGEPISTRADLDQDRVNAILASENPELTLTGTPAKFKDRTLLMSDLPSDGAEAPGDQPPPRGKRWSPRGLFGEHLRLIVWAAVALVVTCALVFGGILLFSTKTTAVTVTATQWERSVETEELVTLTYEDWWDKLPSDAVEVSRTEKQRNTKQEYSHTETRTSEQTSKKSVGESNESYVCGTKVVDKGNGFFDDKKEYCDRKVTEYEDVVVTKTYTTDIYDDVPVYEDWVTYRVKRWVTAFYSTANGSAEPYWPISIVTGFNQRAGDDRRESYSVTVVDQDGNSYTMTTSNYGQWSRLHVGSETTGEVNRFGSMLSINWQ